MPEELKQETVQDLINSEGELLSHAPKVYGEYFAHALEFGDFLSKFLISINPDRYIFAAFLSQVRMNYFLAFFSALRLHHVQAGMNLRQMLESGAWAAYAIANPEQEKFSIEVGGIIEVPDSLEKARNLWLENNFKIGSDAIKKLKGLINSSVAHSNIVYAFNNFRLDTQASKFETPYFDFEDKFLVKSDLWFMSNIALGILDLFNGVNSSLQVVKFSPRFKESIKALEEVNKRLKVEMLKGRTAADPRPDRGVKDH